MRGPYRELIDALGLKIELLMRLLRHVPVDWREVMLLVAQIEADLAGMQELDISSVAVYPYPKTMYFTDPHHGRRTTE